VKTAFRIIYKAVGFILLFFLLGTLFVYIESVAIEGNFNNEEDESGSIINTYEKSIIPIIASAFISYLIIFQIPWFKRSES